MTAAPTAGAPVRLRYEGTDAFLRAYTENVSLGGVFVATESSIAKGMRVLVAIELMEGKGFQVQGQIAWRRPASPGFPAGVGIRFVAVPEALRAWLEEATTRYLAEQGPPSSDLAADHQLRAARGIKDLTDVAINTDAMGIDASSGPVLGIDLGTSNSCACVHWRGQPLILELGDKDRPGDSRSLPSVVAYDDGGKAVVGHAALERLATDARRTIYGSKRFVGRDYDNVEVQKMLPRYPYRVVPGPGRRAAVEVNGKVINLGAIAARILEHIREMAEDRLGVPVRTAIITVPAYYNQNQRHAVTQAARLAGLSVARIVNEPTAAAIAYGLTYSTPKKILVYDLGGGTFDVSVMDVGNKRLTVLSTAGDTFLGGEDLDNAIVAYVAERLRSETGQTLSTNHVALARIKVAAERAKRRLTVHTSTMITVRDAILLDGSSTRLEIELSRDELELIAAPFVTRTLKIADMALEQAHLGPREIHDVVLVGGQTLMPYVQRRVGEHFGKRPRYDLRADEVVAMGAGLLTAMNAAQVAELKDVLSMSIGIAEPGGRFLKLVERNTPVPHRSSHQKRLPAKELSRAVIEIYQGEAPEVSRNERLGVVRLGGLRAGKIDPVPLRIDLVLSPDCLLKVRIANEETGDEVDALLDTRDS